MKNCNKPEGNGSQDRFNGKCKHCGRQVIKNRGKWIHSGKIYLEV